MEDINSIQKCLTTFKSPKEITKGITKQKAILFDVFNDKKSFEKSIKWSWEVINYFTFDVNDSNLPCKNTFFWTNWIEYINLIEDQYNYFCNELLKILKENPSIILENSFIKYLFDNNITNYTHEDFYDYIINILTFDLTKFQRYIKSYYHRQFEDNRLLNFNVDSLNKLDKEWIKIILKSFRFDEIYRNHAEAIEFYIDNFPDKKFDINKFYENKEMVFILIFDKETRLKYLKNEVCNSFSRYYVNRCEVKF